MKRESVGSLNMLYDPQHPPATKKVAWNFGCPQRRSRIIIAIAAPGLAPLPEPAYTHSHPDRFWGGSLGKTANGKHTGSKITSQTLFEYVTPAEATKDLPSTDSCTTCIPFLDHWMSRTMPVIGWVCILSITRFSSGWTFVKACKRGYMPRHKLISSIGTSTSEQGPTRSPHSEYGKMR